MPSNRSFARRFLLWPLIVVACLVSIGAIGIDVMRRAVTMRLADANPAFIASATAGTQVQAVVRIGEAMGNGAMTAELLAAAGGSSYRQTATRVRLALAANTRYIMGAASDIRPGAIVQVDGTIDAPQRLRAAKIVVLNDYVHLAPAN